jgi:putative PEP-CTERM system histidine kinase
MISSIHFISAAACVALAVFSLFQERRAWVRFLFLLGMVALALEALANGLVSMAPVRSEALAWQMWRYRLAAFVPGIWLVVCIGLSSRSVRPQWTRLRWVVALVFLTHLTLIFLFRAAFFTGEAERLAYGWVFALGWAGYGFHLATVFSLVLVFILLERILASVAGRKRWQVKFFVFGIGGFTAVRFFNASLALVYRAANQELTLVHAAVLLAAAPLFLIAMRRSGGLVTDLHISHKALYNSLVLIIVGVFFLALGISAHTLQDVLPFPLRSILVFLALIGLVMALFSDRLRLRLKSFVGTHLAQGRHDYRDIWLNFSRRTATLMDEKALCQEVARMVAERLDALSVSLWLKGDRKRMTCRGSTVFSDAEAESLPDNGRLMEAVAAMRIPATGVIELEQPEKDQPEALLASQRGFIEQARMQFLVPLSFQDSFLGFISLGDRVGGRKLSSEDKHILAAFAQQASASLANIQISQRLRQAREIEAFQTVSAFFVHDLKNLAARLSMMLQNLPGNFDNPEFRQDALRLMSGSVDKINTICARLSSLRGTFEIHPDTLDLNALVRTTLQDMNGYLGCLVRKELADLPRISADPSQLQRVIMNLLLNAREAVGQTGEITVHTAARSGWVELGVADNGRGMSQSFLENRLFRPFQTTKTKGTGIGLFQSKAIVEAHGGRIEVESTEGEGSLFRVLLPIKEGARNEDKGERL